MAQTRKYYSKNNYLTLRSKSHKGHYVKLVRTITFLSFQIGQLYMVCGCMTIRRCVTYRHDHRETLTVDLTKEKNVMAQTRKYYSKNNYLTLRSKSHKGHYGTRHTALWSCTHIPNIIDLSQKTKMLWSDQICFNT
jgi:hypothetical protein